ASKLQQGVELLDLHFTIDATGYQNVFYQGHKYDVILLAPQIGHVYHKVKAVLKEQAVKIIPGEIFATYDVKAAIDLITATYAKNNVIPKKSGFVRARLKVANKKPVLVFSLFRNSQRVHLAYRLYEEDMNIVIDDEIIKPHVKAGDIFHVIDAIMVDHPEIETIGVSTPGIINDDGLLCSTSVRGFENIYLEKMLKERYDVDIVIANDVNTAAVGFYACQDKCESLAFLFQPIHHLSGAGIVINGNLVKGSHNLAGEIQYLPMALSDSPLILNRTIEGSLELVSKTILSIMALIAPEVVVVYCDLITNEDRLYDELGRHLQKSSLPKIVKVTNMLEYTLLGQLILSC
ncbi:MAG: ROK family protein, partial [Erysipelotrichaceae bacterium]|nr:ROK family protein [Erysipelotrichaceae bacterium]